MAYSKASSWHSGKNLTSVEGYNMSTCTDYQPVLSEVRLMRRLAEALREVVEEQPVSERPEGVVIPFPPEEVVRPRAFARAK